MKQYNYTKQAMLAAKEFIRPLPGDYIQLCECKHLATIITKYCQRKHQNEPTSSPASIPVPISLGR
jgi:hypothetical protein